MERPGGLGLGFNGAQLVALAIGGCFCNDLRGIAHRHGVKIGAISVEVALALEGDPVLAASAEMTVRCRMADGSDPAPLIEEAKRNSMVGLSLPRGIPVSVSAGDGQGARPMGSGRPQALPRQGGDQVGLGHDADDPCA